MLRVSQSVENCYIKPFWFVHSYIREKMSMISLLSKITWVLWSFIKQGVNNV